MVSLIVTNPYKYKRRGKHLTQRLLVLFVIFRKKSIMVAQVQYMHGTYMYLPCICMNKLYYLVHPFNAQVLSESMSKALLLICGDNASETAKFVGMADTFFDALNVHNYTHGVHQLKLFQAPYTSSEDMRLEVPVDTFKYHVH